MTTVCQVLVLVLFAAVIVALVILLTGDTAPQRQQIESRAQLTRTTERDIDDIGRRTEEAIMAEAWRRARNGPSPK